MALVSVFHGVYTEINCISNNNRTREVYSVVTLSWETNPSSQCGIFYNENKISDL